MDTEVVSGQDLDEMSREVEQARCPVRGQRLHAHSLPFVGFAAKSRPCEHSFCALLSQGLL